MLIKSGVDISRLSRHARVALGRIDGRFLDSGGELVVTSTYEGNHGGGSLHYSNDAFDFRNRGCPGGLPIDEIKEALGKDFDVVEEGNCVHVEYDPKEGS
jgi:hypothetical protein